MATCPECGSTSMFVAGKKCLACNYVVEIDSITQENWKSAASKPEGKSRKRKIEDYYSEKDYKENQKAWNASKTTVSKHRTTKHIYPTVKQEHLPSELTAITEDLNNKLATFYKIKASGD